MFDKIVYNTLHWLMKWSGKINSWSWKKHVKHIEKKRQEKKKVSSEDLFNGA